jgi:hypothetical protein
MRNLLRVFLICLMMLLHTVGVNSQQPYSHNNVESIPLVQPAWAQQNENQIRQIAFLQKQIEDQQRFIELLMGQAKQPGFAPLPTVPQTQPVAAQSENSRRRQIELLQKQIEDQERFTSELMEHVKKPLSSTPPAPQQLQVEGQQGSDVVFAHLQEDVEQARLQLAAAQQATQPSDKQKKQFDLLQKQIEDQQKMIELLLEHVKKQPLAGTPVEKLQSQVATLEGRSRQAAQRDQDLAQSVDNLAEHVDALERNGPRLPASLKELFFPSQTNETPVSIYTNLVVGYNSPETGTAGPFFGNFSPHLRLVLNEWIYAIGEIDVSSNGAVDVSDAEFDFIANDWLTIVVGRFPAPIGFFNERLNSPWINKLPDLPLMFRQVSPPISLNGVQARGAHYIFDLPVKIAYSLYGSSGLELNNQAPGLNDVANLENMENTYNVVSSEPTFGGRLSLWYPAMGIEVGVSGLHNADYTPVAEDGIQLWELDANYHKCNWDLRFEFAQMYQHAASFIGTNIRRQGLYAQAAYRPLDAANAYLQKLELVARYSYTSFHGIDPTALDLTTFATSLDVPVNRNQYTFGINYWFYPSLVLQVAYEINREPGFPLHDSIFMAQLGWGF